MSTNVQQQEENESGTKPSSVAASLQHSGLAPSKGRLRLTVAYKHRTAVTVQNDFADAANLDLLDPCRATISVGKAGRSLATECDQFNSHKQRMKVAFISRNVDRPAATEHHRRHSPGEEASPPEWFGRDTTVRRASLMRPEQRTTVRE